MYGQYFRRMGEPSERGEQRSLFFHIETDKEGVQEYSVVGTIHQVKFKADTSKLWKQLENCEDKYGWTIPRSKTYGTGAGGVEMIKPPGEASVFYHAIDTSGGNSVSPHRQAGSPVSFSIEYLAKPLSGMSVTDLPSDHTPQNPMNVL